jgi:hypothetical protein
MSKLIPYASRPAAGKGGNVGETALGLVYNFLNEPQLRKMSDLAMGGTFPAKYFKLNPKCYAKQFWYCYAKGSLKPQHQIFLAMEDSWKGWPRNMTEKQIPLSPESKALVKPSAPFAFDDDRYDRKNIAEVSDFIQNQEDAPKAVVKVTDKEVVKYSRAFVSAFGGVGKKYCRYPLGYFENFELETKRLYIDEFMSQGEVAYVRYYFGLDKSYHTNKIRIVLFPVSATKKALSPNAGGRGMLEESWPPPPPVT